MYTIIVRSAVIDMKNIFFIDSENVGDSWIPLLDTTNDEDEIIVFYTSKSPHMSYANLIHLKESKKTVTFIECTLGNNALDFQLCTELGFRIHDISDNQFIIVSKDTGFDAVVKYWSRQKYSVSRITGDACAKLNQHSEADVKMEPASEEPEVISISPANAFTNDSTSTCESTAEENDAQITEPAPIPQSEPVPTPKPIPGGIDATAKEIFYIIGPDNLQTLHTSLQQLYGNKRGSTYYNAFKTDPAYYYFIDNHQQLSLHEKQKTYCQIVFKKYDSSLVMPDDFSEFITKSWKSKSNLNSLRASLQGKYGKELCEKYYSLIKAHVKILAQIK